MKDIEILAGSSVFNELTPAQRARAMALMKRRGVARGEPLVAASDPAEALFVVSHGAFTTTPGNGAAPERFCAGDIIGATAFFGGMPHSETVTAQRDAEVLEFDRTGYGRLAEIEPAVSTMFLAHLARRMNAGAQRPMRPRREGTFGAIAVVAAGVEPVPPAFFAALRRALERTGAIVLDRAGASELLGEIPPGARQAAALLNRIEGERQVVFLAEERSGEWAERAVRQADAVVMVTAGKAPGPELTATERLACELHPASARRLVRVHRRRVGVVSGTASWLARIEVGLHHHVSLEDNADIESLARFLTGWAIGFVAGGGGGLGPAHVGIYKAFREHGATFDVFMGTSVGAAMLAGFAFLGDHETLTAGTHDIFVKSRSFKRPTWPRYALLDHKVFDDALARAYGDTTRVEDCWRPFFAVATNLSTQRLELIRSGLLWQAVRASSAIPCVLPPFITEDGTLLADGGIMDDAPLAPMQQIKAGPNLVVHFGRTGEQRYQVSYEEVPGRMQLLASLVNPRARLPRMPRIMGMLFRTMLAHQRYELPAGPLDLVLSPPPLKGASLMSFDRHREVSGAAHAWAIERIAERAQAADPALAAILSPEGGFEQELAAAS